MILLSINATALNFFGSLIFVGAIFVVMLRDVGPKGPRK